MDTDKELQTKLDDRECDIVTSFATYLMQKQQDEIDKLRAEIKRLEKENGQLRAEYKIFNCDVCKRHCYFASPCTPDDCEARYNEFCEREGYKEIKNLK